jgi:hypothetical protein
MVDNKNIRENSDNKENATSENTLKDTNAQKTRGIFGKIGGAVKSGSRKVRHTVLLKKHNSHIQKLIIAQFNLKEIQNLCLFFNIGSPHPVGFDSKDELVLFKPTYDDWKNHAFKHIELWKLREYAKKRNKIPYEISELEKQYKQERREKYPEYETDDETGLPIDSSHQCDMMLVQELINAIEEFRPIKVFRNEELYHTNLYTYLCEKIPREVGFEEQRGRSRPDIVVGDIAIEVKGPTDNQGLITIADKINRYSQHFDHIIVVLFEVQVFEKFYQEWYESIMRHYDGQVTIIRKLNAGPKDKSTPTSSKESPTDQPSVPPKGEVGYCIRCRAEIPINAHRPLCETCYPIWAKFSNVRYQEKYCHICGKMSKQSYSKPVCYTCWKGL